MQSTINMDQDEEEEFKSPIEELKQPDELLGTVLRGNNLKPS